MRNLQDEPRARSIHDPLGVTSHADKSRGGEAAAETHPEQDISPVNPLWMITAGLGAFVVLLVVVW